MEFERFIDDNWVLVLVLIAWSLFWKGLALWRAAERKAKGWFIFFLIVNTLGLVEIFYLCWWARKKRRHTHARSMFG